jgi:hypothetical protein
MKQKNIPRRQGWAAAWGIFLVGCALFAPQASFAGDKKDKGVPIVVGQPIVTNDPPPKKK